LLQRLAYYNARQKAIEAAAAPPDPQKKLENNIMTLIIDGMDQATTRIPHAPVLTAL
jgi:hypothetical protein